MFMLDGKVLPLDVQFEHGGVTYPANWLRLTTLAEKQAIGITEVPDPVRPDDRYYWVSQNADGSFTATPKDLDGLKTMRIAEVKEMAGKLLSPTDWKVIRSYETGIAIPSDLLAARQAIRDKSNTFEAQINACADVEALRALTFEWADPPTE